MLVASFFVCLLLVSFVYGELSARAWQSKDSFPNENDFPEIPFLKNRPNTGIAFTGGGSRAYIAAIGQLAALHELGLTKNIRYVGGISGGAWATSAFSWVQNVKDDSTFLGPVVPPEEFSLDKLQEMDPNSARRLSAPDLTVIGLKAFAEKIVTTVPDAWAYGVSKTYLEPIGVVPGKYFSWNEDSVAEILARNPSLKRDDFTTIVVDRPYPIIGTSLVGPTDGAPYTNKNQNYTLLEITPLYIGQLRTLDVTYNYTRSLLHPEHKRRVGGALEPFAWSHRGQSPSRGLLPKQTSGILNVPEPTKVMDVAMSAAASSYAPGSFVEAFHPKELASALGMHFDYWSPSDPAPSAVDTLFTDGGAYENIVLFSYLQRRVSKIVLFFNSATPLAPSDRYNPFTDKYTGDEVSDCLSAFFGVLPDPMSKFENRSFEYEMDQVFAKDDFARVVSALQTAQKAGNGIVATFNLTTVENAWWGIPAGLSVEITFSYLGRLSAWESKLPKLIKHEFVPNNDADAADLSKDIKIGPFRDFPHYLTTGGNINSERANALADMTGWAVLQHADTFRRILQ